MRRYTEETDDVWLNKLRINCGPVAARAFSHTFSVLSVSCQRKEFVISYFRCFALAASDVLSDIASCLIEIHPRSRH
jgi:hypothetical protein